MVNKIRLFQGDKVLVTKHGCRVKCSKGCPYLNKIGTIQNLNYGGDGDILVTKFDNLTGGCSGFNTKGLKLVPNSRPIVGDEVILINKDLPCSYRGIFDITVKELFQPQLNEIGVVIEIKTVENDKEIYLLLVDFRNNKTEKPKLAMAYSLSIEKYNNEEFYTNEYVMVTTKIFKQEGWEARWHQIKDRTIGRIGKVVTVKKGKYITVKFRDINLISFDYAPKALTKISKEDIF